MRNAIVVVAIVLVGCSDDHQRLDALEASAGAAAGLQRELDALKAAVAALPAGVDVKPLEDRIAALEAKVAALPPPVDVKPLEDRIAALEAKAPGAVKLPHLVVDKTGEDLGQLLASDLVWSPQLKAEIAVTSLTPLYFDQPNCAGNAAARGVRQRSRINTSTGNLYRVSGALMAFQSQSFLDNLGNCTNRMDAVQAAPVVDTNIKNIIFAVELLRIDVL